MALHPARPARAQPHTQVTAELQKLEAKRASAADGSAPLRAELRRLEAQGAEAERRVAAKQQLLGTMEGELADLQVVGADRRRGCVCEGLCVAGEGREVAGACRTSPLPVASLGLPLLHRPASPRPRQRSARSCWAS